MMFLSAVQKRRLQKQIEGPKPRCVTPDEIKTAKGVVYHRIGGKWLTQKEVNYTAAQYGQGYTFKRH